MQECNSVAVHVRRGDYLKCSIYTNLGESNYYQNAINYINAHEKDVKYYIFSNDIPWCKESGLFGENATYVDFNIGDRSYEDMYLITQCKKVVMANSSFSWWGAYLGEHDYVIRPNGHMVGWTEEKDKGFYPSEWIKMDLE